MNWIKNLEPLLARHVKSYNEIPDFFGYYSPQIVEDFSNVYSHKILPGDKNQILHTELSLLDKAAQLAVLKLKLFDHINIFDLASTTGDGCLPLILDLLIEEKTVNYTPVTSNIKLNRFAISKIKEMVLLEKLSGFSSDSVETELEVSDCQKEILKIKNKFDPQQSSNLFLLLDSRLGNSINPGVFLRNISNSMTSGDFLILVQSIFSPGRESYHLTDFQNLLNCPSTFEPTKEFAKLFMHPEERSIDNILVQWYEGDKETDFKTPRVICKVKNRRKSLFHELEIEADKEITIFRSTRFYRSYLESLILTSGLNIVEIGLDESYDNAFFFLKKK